MDGIFEAVQAQTGAPSKEEIVAASAVNDMAADWDHLEKHLERIVSQKLSGHVPLVITLGSGTMQPASAYPDVTQQQHQPLLQSNVMPNTPDRSCEPQTGHMPAADDMSRPLMDQGDMGAGAGGQFSEQQEAPSQGVAMHSNLADMVPLLQEILMRQNQSQGARSI